MGGSTRGNSRNDAVMKECYHCGVIYEVVLDEDFEGEQINFCPACGHEAEIELDFEE